MKQHQKVANRFFPENKKLKMEAGSRWMEAFLAWVFLEAILFSIKDICVTEAGLIAAMFGGSLLILLSWCFRKKEKLSAILRSGVNIVCLAVFFLFLPYIAQALLGQCNQVIQLCNQRFNTEIGRFSVDGRAAAGAVLLWLLLSIVLVKILLWQIRKFRLAGPLVLLLIALGMGFVLGSSGKSIAVILTLLAFFAMLNWYSMPDKKIGIRQIIFLGMVIGVVIVGAVVHPKFRLLDELADWKAQISDRVEEMRYGSDTLPQGNFYNVSGLLDGEDERLQITMSRPTELYLKGFVGSIYHSSGWTALPAESYQDEYEGMLSWLSGEDFSPVRQYAEYRGLTIREKGIEVPVTEIKVTNTGADQRYVYLPATVKSWSGGRTRILRDWSVCSGSFFGTSEYEFKMVLGNQTAEKVTQEDWLASAANTKQTVYLNAESVYHAFVKENYLKLDERKKQLVDRIFFPNGIKNMDFNQITAQIRNVLRQQVQYIEDPQELPEGEDELLWFLQEYKKGNAVSYATAAVLAYRAAGYPARYVEGYHLSDEEAKTRMADGNRTLTLTTGNAHAWAEVYIAGAGWMPIEVVPGFYVETYSNQVVKGRPSYQIDASAIKNSTDTRQKENSGAGNQKKKASAQTKMISGKVVIVIVLLLCYTAFAIYLILEVQRGWRIRKRGKQKKRAEREGCFIQFYVKELENVLISAKIYEGFGNSPDLWYNIKQSFPGIEPYEYYRTAELLQKAQFGGCVLQRWELRTIDIFIERLKQARYRKLGAIQKVLMRYRDAF